MNSSKREKSWNHVQGIPGKEEVEALQLQRAWTKAEIIRSLEIQTREANSINDDKDRKKERETVCKKVEWERE